MIYIHKYEGVERYDLPLVTRPVDVTTGAGIGAWTIGGAAGSNKGLLGKSSNVKPVTEALSRGFLIGVAFRRCCFWVSLIIFTFSNVMTYIFF